MKTAALNPHRSAYEFRKSRTGQAGEAKWSSCSRCAERREETHPALGERWICLHTTFPAQCPERGLWRVKKLGYAYNKLYFLG